MSTADAACLAAAAQAPTPWPGPRTYAGAITALNLLQSNASMLDARRAEGPRFDDRIPAEVDSLRRIGYAPDDLNRLRVIHIAGTKGKGSTAAFTSSLLCTRFAQLRAQDHRSAAAPEHGQRAPASFKVGLYTSPHMISARERIRINGLPLPETLFVRYFFDVWDRLGSPPTASYGGDAVGHPSWPLRPFYFRFLTLLSWHVFLSEQVDAAVVEVGIGGRFDSTNVVPRPMVAGVTSLGIDHTFLLGSTLPEIAWQKGGVFKPYVPAVATFQATPEAEAVLQTCAQEEKASSFTILRQAVQSSIVTQVNQAGGLGLPGVHQSTNAALAVLLSRAFFHETGQDSGPSTAEPAKFTQDTTLDTLNLTQEEIEALVSARWPGRCQVVYPPPSVQDRKTDSVSVSQSTSASEEPKHSDVDEGVLSMPGARHTTFYLDGAHTTDSLALCAEWFVPRSSADAQSQAPARPQDPPLRALVFNCTNGRSVADLVRAIQQAVESALKSLSTSPEGTRSSAKGILSPSAPDALYPLVASYFDAIYFTTNETFATGSRGDMISHTTDPTQLAALTVQHDLRSEWLRSLGMAADSPYAERIHVCRSIEEALNGITGLAAVSGSSSGMKEDGLQICDPRPVHTLVTGSLLLVGGVMAHLKQAGRLDEALVGVY